MLIAALNERENAHIAPNTPSGACASRKLGAYSISESLEHAPVWQLTCLETTQEKRGVWGGRTCEPPKARLGVGSGTLQSLDCATKIPLSIKCITHTINHMP